MIRLIWRHINKIFSRLNHNDLVFFYALPPERESIMQIKVDIRELYPDYKGENPIIEINSSQWEAIMEVAHIHRKNEKKHEMRRIRTEEMYGYTENLHDKNKKDFSTNENPTEETVFLKLEKEKLLPLLEKLTPIQKRRLCQYYINDLTFRDIARLENVNEKSVRESINSAMKKLRKLL